MDASRNEPVPVPVPDAATTSEVEFDRSCPAAVREPAAAKGVHCVLSGPSP